MYQSITEKSKYKNITANTLIKSGAGRIRGVFVASTASGTLKFWDNTAGSGTVLINTVTPSAGDYYPFPDVGFENGLYVTKGGTSIDCTIFYN